MFGTVAILFKGLMGSFIGRAVAIGLAALVALGINNAFQRSVGAKTERIKIVKKTNETAKKRDKTIRKSRNKRPRSAVRDRMLRKYARPD